MSFEPDVVVVSPGAAHLIAEARLQRSQDADPAEALRNYMLRMRVPAGMLVTPETVSIFRDTFRSESQQSIEQVAVLRTAEIPELQPFATGLNRDPIAFEDAVQAWLVHLRARLIEGDASGVDPVLAEHIVPALAMGEIRAAGPRRRAAIG